MVSSSGVRILGRDDLVGTVVFFYDDKEGRLFPKRVNVT